MRCVILLFDRLTVLDAIGPYEVLRAIPQASLCFVGLESGVIRSEDGTFAMHIESTIDEVSECDLLLVPGGIGTRRMMRDRRLLDWIVRLDTTTRITASVCTGALVLGAAGLLRGRRANTHFALRERLPEFGALPVPDRVVIDGKYRTAAGVSAGIDLALGVAKDLSGQRVAETIQLALEYAPEPPVVAGRVERAPRDMVETVRRRTAEAERAYLAELEHPRCG